MRNLWSAVNVLIFLSCCICAINKNPQRFISTFVPKSSYVYLDITVQIT